MVTESEISTPQLTGMLYVSAVKPVCQNALGERVSAALSHIINPTGTLTASTNSNVKNVVHTKNGRLNKHMHSMYFHCIMSTPKQL